MIKPFTNAVCAKLYPMFHFLQWPRKAGNPGNLFFVIFLIRNINVGWRCMSRSSSNRSLTAKRWT